MELSPKPYDLRFQERHLTFDQRKGIQLWPNGARMGVLIYIAAEEWQWDRLEQFGVPGGRYMSNETRPSLSTYSSVKYGFEIGLYRMRDILQERHIRATIWATGNSVEQHPEIIKEFSGLGHEIGAHGYTQGSPLSTMSREEQRENIRKTVEIITRTTGKRPVSWIGPVALCNEDTIELLAEAGFICNSDLQDDEIPYFIDVNGKTLVEIPYRMVGNINDSFMTIYNSKHVEDMLIHLKSAFDAYYREASKRQLLFNFGTHPFVSGRPDTAYVFAQFLEYILHHEDLWITTYNEIAKWWTERFGKGYKL